jgi:DNA/RNA-binding domain of Phe-tRNA-synthetase-like protein
MRFDISEIAASFPDFRVAVLTCEELAIPKERPAALEALISQTESEARRLWGGIELSAIPEIAAWRQAYRRFGVKKTSYRSSVERLLRLVLAGGALPSINAFVDAYNAISLAALLPAGADDLDEVRGDLAFRFAREGDNFQDMGAMDEAGLPMLDPPKPGEVVYADAEKVLCRRWNWRQDARSVIRPDTRRAVVTIQANGVGDPEAAARRLAEILADCSGGAVTLATFDAGRPAAESPRPGALP